MPLAALSISAFFLTLPHHVPTTLSPFSTSYDSCAGLLRMVHFALLLLLAQAFLPFGMPYLSLRGASERTIRYRCALYARQCYCTR